MSINPIIYEQTTAVTDLILGISSFCCFIILYRIRKTDLYKMKIWLWIFGLLVFNSLYGTAAHGIYFTETALYYIWLPLTFLLGIMISLFVTVVVYDYYGKEKSKKIMPYMIASAFLFFIASLFISKIISTGFIVFIIFEGCAMLYALVAYIRHYKKCKLPSTLYLSAGILVTIIAALLQASRAIYFTIIWPFDYNSVYHFVQMIGMFLFTRGLYLSSFEKTD